MAKHVSASQVGAWDRCQRYWHYTYVQGLKQPPSAAMALGSKVHKSIENFLKGKPFDEDMNAYVEAVKPHLPKSNALEIEKRILEPTYPGGPEWLGFVDLVDYGVDPIHIIDYKTTSDARWSKTPTELLVNTQLIAYAKALAGKKFYMDRDDYDDTVQLSHINIVTGKKPKVFMVSVEVTLGHVEDQWTKEVKKVQEMSACERSVKDVNDLPPNTDSCMMYGGCPFRGQCGLVPTHKLTLPKKELTMENGKTYPPVPTSNDKFLARLLKKPGTYAPSAETEISPKVQAIINGTAGGTTTLDVLPTKADPAPVLPPDAAPRDYLPPAPAAPVKTAEEEAPKKRGRPRKVHDEVEAPAVEAVSIAPAEDFFYKSDTDKSVSANVVKTFTLYVDCYPVKGLKTMTTLAEDWLRPVLQAVEEEHQVEDVRLLSFVQSKGGIATAIKKRLHLLPETLVVSSQMPHAHDLIEILSPHASVVVRALRG